MSTGYTLPSRSNLGPSDIRALWCSGLSARVPEWADLNLQECKMTDEVYNQYKWQHIPVG